MLRGRKKSVQYNTWNTMTIATLLGCTRATVRPNAVAYLTIIIVSWLAKLQCAVCNAINLWLWESLFQKLSTRLVPTTNMKNSKELSSTITLLGDTVALQYLHICFALVHAPLQASSVVLVQIEALELVAHTRELRRQLHRLLSLHQPTTGRANVDLHQKAARDDFRGDKKKKKKKCHQKRGRSSNTHFIVRFGLWTHLDRDMSVRWRYIFSHNYYDTQCTANGLQS